MATSLLRVVSNVLTELHAVVKWHKIRMMKFINTLEKYDFKKTPSSRRLKQSRTGSIVHI